MVKLYGPAFSLDASGTIGDAITFSKWKGRHYARERIVPANPKSGLQVGFRSMFSFLAQNWAALSAPNKASYETLADSMAISPFNAYVRMNQKRWRNFKAPSHATPATETGSVGTFTAGTPAATGGVASVSIDWEIDNVVGDNWGLAIFKGDTAFSSGISNCVACRLADDAVAQAWVDSPLDPGTYYYQTRLFTDDGVLGAELGEINGTAT